MGKDTQPIRIEDSMISQDHADEFRQTNEKGKQFSDGLSELFKKIGALKISRRNLGKGTGLVVGAVAALEANNFVQAQDTVPTPEAFDAIARLFDGVTVQVAETTVNLSNTTLETLTDEEMRQVLIEFSEMSDAAVNNVNLPSELRTVRTLLQVTSADADRYYVLDAGAEHGFRSAEPESGEDQTEETRRLSVLEAVGVGRRVQVRGANSIVRSAPGVGNAQIGVINNGGVSGEYVVVTGKPQVAGEHTWYPIEFGQPGEIQTGFIANRNVNGQQNLDLQNYTYVMTEAALLPEGAEAGATLPANESIQEEDVDDDDTGEVIPGLPENPVPLVEGSRGSGLFGLSVRPVGEGESVRIPIQGTDIIIRGRILCEDSADGTRRQFYVAYGFENSSQTILLRDTVPQLYEELSGDQRFANAANRIFTAGSVSVVGTAFTSEGALNNQSGEFLSEAIAALSSAQEAFIRNGEVPPNQTIIALQVDAPRA